MKSHWYEYITPLRKYLAGLAIHYAARGWQVKGQRACRPSRKGFFQAVSRTHTACMPSLSWSRPDALIISSAACLYHFCMAVSSVAVVHFFLPMCSTVLVFPGHGAPGRTCLEEEMCKCEALDRASTAQAGAPSSDVLQLSV